MANDITCNPWKLDSTGAVYTRRVKILRVVWTPTTAAHTLILHDRHGDVILSLVANANNQLFDIDLNNWYAGLTVNALGSSIAYIHV